MQGIASHTIEATHSLQKEAGFTAEQAEGIIKVLDFTIGNNVATKADIESLRQDMETLGKITKADIELLRQDMETLGKITKADIELLRQDTKADIELLRQENKGERLVMRWMFGVLIALLVPIFIKTFLS